MEKRKLGNTDIEVSLICLGTMTWGQQNTEKEGHEQLDYAIAQGVNFIDTAELYSVPARPETYGATETIIGNWIEKRGKRDDFYLASKVAGPGDFTKHMRAGNNFSPDQIKEAIEGSLKRLKTDYLDLYQLHWPERPTNYFGKLGYTHQSDDVGTPIATILETLQTLIKEGKIRYVGLSNETPWGLHEFLKVSETMNLPRVVSVQNPYSLINRTYEIGMAEMSIREECGLLAYSPLAGGLLSGKYLGGKQPEDSRFTLFPNFMTRYSHGNVKEAISEYRALAKKIGISLTQMSLAFVNQQAFLTSNIIGATTMDQLKEDIDSVNIKLTEDQLKDIEYIHLKYPNPGP